MISTSSHLPSTNDVHTENLPNQITENNEEKGKKSDSSNERIVNYSIEKELPSSTQFQEVRSDQIQLMGNESNWKSDLLVHVSTWNIHGKLPTRQNLEELLGRGQESSKYDIIAIGTQECQKSIPISVFLPSKRRWEGVLQEFLKDTHRPISMHTLVAIHLIVFIKRDMFPLVSEIHVDRVSTGIMNILGNKGAVAISFQLYGKSFLFISSHLSAHQEKSNGRTRDYHRINYAYVCNRFDYVFWCGDLNYRINGIRSAIDAILEKGMVEVLWANDQLKKEMDSKRVFYGFYEYPVNFPPTYKYDLNSDKFDTSRRARIPSWTDRILIKTAFKFTVLEYFSHSSLKISDHKPVTALFLLAADNAETLFHSMGAQKIQ